MHLRTLRVVDTQQLRQAVKAKWLNYYAENRQWLTRLGVWVSCDGQRRPSSGFILATLSVLEPQLTKWLPLIVDLSSNPDRIIVALGLNFNPDEELDKLNQEADQPSAEPKLLPAAAERPFSPAKTASLSHLDESCRGVRGEPQ